MDMGLGAGVAAAAAAAGAPAAAGRCLACIAGAGVPSSIGTGPSSQPAKGGAAGADVLRPCAGMLGGCCRRVVAAAWCIEAPLLAPAAAAAALPCPGGAADCLSCGPAAPSMAACEAGCCCCWPDAERLVVSLSTGGAPARGICTDATGITAVLSCVPKLRGNAVDDT